MCGVCGCGQTEVVLDRVRAGGAEPHGERQGLVHDHGDGTGPHVHPHAHGRHDGESGDRRDHRNMQDDGPAAATGASAERLIRIEQDILSKNDAFARENRSAFAVRRLFVLNVVSSPGSGKTSLLVKSIEALNGRLPVAVIEGDQQTSNDAERIRATGAPAIQINTGKGCHLDAHMVGHALETLDPPSGAALFIENVGNLVCPAAFDLGEARRVVVLSVTEGEDKPLKYPDMFATADLHAAQQGGPPAASRFRRRPVSRQRAEDQPEPADPDRLGADRRGRRGLRRLDRGQRRPPRRGRGARPERRGRSAPALRAGGRRLRLRVRGVVQGVGFRPFAYGLAGRLHLSGFVRNDGEGVLIEIEGPRAQAFLTALETAPPPLARIDSIEVDAIAPIGRRRLRDRDEPAKARLDHPHRRGRRDLRELP